MRRTQPGLLVIPPFTHPNAPYASVPMLTGFLRSRGHAVRQADLGLETLLALFSRRGLERLFAEVRASRRPRPGPVERMLALESAYLDATDPVVAFLQGRDDSLATRICHGPFLPRGPRFAPADDDDWAFGTLGITDRARRLATLFLEDLGDLVRATVAPEFGLARYAERLARSARRFDPIARALSRPENLVERLLREIALPHLEKPPAFVGITVPFPGTLLGALLVARIVKQTHPQVPVILGGGWVSTELRDLADPRLFDLADYVALDAGERPLLCLVERFLGRRDERRLCRTLARRRGRIVTLDGAAERDFAPAETGTPTHDGLPERGYVALVEIRNPLRRLWSDGRWNRLQVAHGCCWRRCAFCDASLDYVRRYAPVPVETLIERIESLVAETGSTGFHFVDEAAPPAALKAMALALLERGPAISWWANIRFETAFTPDLCRLLSASGCVAVTGGLETACDRTLALMDKGITAAGAARVAAAFADAGVMVHAYLMFGFPSQTARETVEGLERVRQLFSAGAIQSAFWHRFTLTSRSAMAADPAAWGIAIRRRARATFASNDLEHRDRAGCDPERFADGLDRAAEHFMHGLGLDRDVRTWFERRVPAPRVPPDFVERAIADRPDAAGSERTGRLVWLGGAPRIERDGRGGSRLVLASPSDETSVSVSDAVARWLSATIRDATPRGRERGRPYPTIAAIREGYPAGARRPFEEFLRSRVWSGVRRAGLVIV